MKWKPHPLLFIAAPAAVAIWTGWVGLGGMAGFGWVTPLPGIAPLRIDTAITLPVGVEAYGVYALAAWLSPGTPEKAKAFARWSAIGALGLGMLGQVAFHLLAAAGADKAPWPVTVAVSCVPVVVVGFAAALTHLLRAQPAEPSDKKPRFIVADAPQSVTPEPVTVVTPVTAPKKTTVEQQAKARGVSVRTRYRQLERERQLVAVNGNGKAHG